MFHTESRRLSGRVAVAAGAWGQRRAVRVLVEPHPHQAASTPAHAPPDTHTNQRRRRETTDHYGWAVPLWGSLEGGKGLEWEEEEARAAVSMHPCNGQFCETVV